MGRILGSAVIRANSKQLKSKPGATFDPGGSIGTPHPGPGRIWGFSEKFNPPSIQVTIVADEDVDVIELNAIRDATITWEGDNGVDYMITGCRGEGFTLSDESGDMSGTFNGMKAEKV